MAKVRCINCEKKINLKKDDRISDESLGTYWCVACGYEDACKALQEEVEELREALEFYADESNYNEHRGTRVFGDIFYDEGKKARQALGLEGNP